MESKLLAIPLLGSRRDALIKHKHELADTVRQEKSEIQKIVTAFREKQQNRVKVQRESITAIEQEAITQYNVHFDKHLVLKERKQKEQQFKKRQIKLKVRDDVMNQTQKLDNYERFVLPSPQRSKGSSSPTRQSLDFIEGSISANEIKSMSPMSSFHIRSASQVPEDSYHLHHRYWHERVKPDLLPEISERLKINLELRKEFLRTKRRYAINKAKLPSL
mmetsp:Transcript_21889/g.39921  ORF Transcript_21889/g.39921 Transcript_21889/m.39921 type:complete len:219 (+) Transcript_21889:307-963(+)